MIRVPLCCRSCLVVVPLSCQLTVWIHIFLCCRWVKMTSCVLGGASVVVLVPVRGVCAVEGLYFLRDFLYFFG